MVPSCQNIHLRNTNENGNREHFFRVPKDSLLKRKWCEAISEHCLPPVPLSVSIFLRWLSETSSLEHELYQSFKQVLNDNIFRNWTNLSKQYPINLVIIQLACPGKQGHSVKHTYSDVFTNQYGEVFR